MGILSKRDNVQVRVKETSTAAQLDYGDGKFIQGERQRLAQEIFDRAAAHAPEKDDEDGRVGQQGAPR